MKLFDLLFGAPALVLHQGKVHELRSTPLYTGLNAPDLGVMPAKLVAELEVQKKALGRRWTRHPKYDPNAKVNWSLVTKFRKEWEAKHGVRQPAIFDPVAAAPGV